MAIYQKYVRPSDVGNPNKYNEPECNGSTDWIFKWVFKLALFLFIAIVLLAVLKLSLIILMY